MAPRRTLVFAVLAGIFGSLDSALNVAFPDLSDAFDLGVGGLRWVILAFVLTSGVCFLGSGRLGDRTNHTSVLATGAAIAAVALLICGTAPSFTVFLVGRVIQGLGTALIMASTPALIALGAPESEQGSAMGRFQMSAAIGLAMGPFIGGPVVELFGWRGVFIVRIPIALALLSLGLAGRRTVRERVAPHRRRLAGAREGLRSVDFLVANALSVLINGALFTPWIIVPALLVDEIGLSALTAGFILTIAPAATALTSWATGPLVDRGRSGPLVVAGLALGATGLGLLSRVTDAWSAVPIAFCLLLLGIALGLFVVPNMTTVMGALPRSSQGVAGGLSLTTRTLGIVIGVLGTSTVFNSVEIERGFLGAFRLVFVTMALITLIAGALELVRRLVSSA